MATIDAGLRDSLERGYTLPAHWYGDAGIFALERERIFARSWQYVGRTEQVAEHGAFFTAHCGHVPVVVLRDADTLRGFVNVCRHRAHLVVQGSGRRTSLQCPYHAWTYGLDGCLRGAPRSKRERGFDMAEFPLLPVSVSIVGPLVFANPDPGAGPLEEAVGPLASRLAEGGVELDDLRLYERVEWESPVNWKTSVENYLECYHCAVAHPGFARVIDVDPDAYVLTAEHQLLSGAAPMRETRENGDGTAPLPAGDVTLAQYHLLFPSTSFNVEPGPPNLSIDQWLPAGPAAMRGVTDFFVGRDVPDHDARAILDFSAQVNAEDVALVAGVQAGLDSGMVPQGRLLTDSEQLIGHFQRRVLDALA